MQRNFCVAMIESVALTPWLRGNIRLALTWTRAPLLISGVPLHRGQNVLRLLKKATSQLTALNAMQPTNKATALCFGSRITHARAVRPPITPR